MGERWKVRWSRSRGPVLNDGGEPPDVVRCEDGHEEVFVARPGVRVDPS
jgi:hypothetical protein